MIKKSVASLIPIFSLLLCLGITACQSEKKASSKKIARIACNEDITTLDPRKARTLNSVNVVRSLFEGLTKRNADGSISPALAEKITLSEDGTEYRFSVRKCSWSDNTPLTAHDFAYTWFSTLTQETASPHAYQLFLIEGAQEFYEKKAPKEAVGIRVENEETLVVKLKEPVPYFLELLDFHAFYPISEKNAQSGQKVETVCSGPFLLEDHKPSFEITLKKNPHYWDKENVRLDEVQFLIADDTTALNMLEAHTVDWAGSPMGTIPADAIVQLKKENKLSLSPTAGTHIVRANVNSPYFTSNKIRRAFCVAIDRENICTHILQGGQTPAYAFVPPCLNPHYRTPTQKTSTSAKKLFEEGKLEINASLLNASLLNTAPFENGKTPTLSYLSSERNQKIALALQEGWRQILGVEVALEPCEAQSYHAKIKARNYDLAIGSWIADFNDPINFLEVFASQNNGTNNTGWESSSYSQKLQASKFEKDATKRQELLLQAEEELLLNAPLFPIFHYVFNYAQNDKLQGVEVSPLGLLSLKNSTMESTQK